MPLKESDLFEPVKRYLEKQGYQVRSEVLHCDITATKNEELIIIELKVRFSVNLLLQAIKRQEAADSVYIALPVPVGKRVPVNFRGICKLCRRLELGLILVSFLKTKTKVEVVFHPGEYLRRRNHRYRRSLLREIDGRYRNFNKGGSTSRTEKITSYKLEVIRIACFLRMMGQASPAQLKARGTGRKTNAILSRNFYGWFQRLKRGVYTLHREGEKALERYPEIRKRFEKEFS